MLHRLDKYNATNPSADAGVSIIENVSRRSVLAGITGFAVAMQVMPAMALDAYPHGGQTMPHGVVNDPHVFVSIDAIAASARSP